MQKGQGTSGHLLHFSPQNCLVEKFELYLFVWIQAAFAKIHLHRFAVAGLLYPSSAKFPAKKARSMYL